MEALRCAVCLLIIIAAILNSACTSTGNSSPVNESGTPQQTDQSQTVPGSIQDVDSRVPDTNETVDDTGVTDTSAYPADHNCAFPMVVIIKDGVYEEGESAHTISALMSLSSPEVGSHEG